VKDTCLEAQPSVIGHDAENPVMLTACERLDVFIDQQAQVRRGDRKVGIWHLEVAKPGAYTFDLYRYPPESGLNLRDAVEPTEVTDGTLVGGPAFPVASARLEIAGRTPDALVPHDTGSIRFKTGLAAGPATLTTTFIDHDRKPIAGAYYVRVQRLPDDSSPHVAP
jgi:hypothetical protein